MAKRRSTYQKIGWNRHGGGNDCGCHKEEEFHKTVCDRAKTEMQPDDTAITKRVFGGKKDELPPDNSTTPGTDCKNKSDEKLFRDIYTGPKKDTIPDEKEALRRIYGNPAEIDIKRTCEYEKNVHSGVHECPTHDCDCHREEKLNYSPEQINALLKKVEEGADGLAIVDLKGKTAGDSIPRIPVQCIFSYDEKEVETIPFTRNGVTGTLVFVDIAEEGIENARLYYIVGRTILNIWPITDAPEWTKVWTKKQLEMIMELRDNLSLTTNR